MAIDICSCGGHINGWSTSKEDAEILEGLVVCIDCGKNYIKKPNKLTPISRAELRRITFTRRHKRAEAKELDVKE